MRGWGWGWGVDAGMGMGMGMGRGCRDGDVAWMRGCGEDGDAAWIRGWGADAVQSTVGPGGWHPGGGDVGARWCLRSQPWGTLASQSRGEVGWGPQRRTWATS